MIILERYWAFAALCMLLALFMFRMVIKERVTLQASLSFLLVLLLTIGVSLFPEGANWAAHQLGFSLVSNFFLACAIGALAFLHLASLIHLSRVQLRSITLTQELALVQERLDRALAHLEQVSERIQLEPRARG